MIAVRKRWFLFKIIIMHCLPFCFCFQLTMDGGPIDGIRGASMVQTDAMYQV